MAVAPLINPAAGKIVTFARVIVKRVKTEARLAKSARPTAIVPSETQLTAVPPLPERVPAERSLTDTEGPVGLSARSTLIFVTLGYERLLRF
jgi:hypothetical protein